MSTFLFGVLLRLLPGNRRRHFGDEMRDVHSALASDARRHGGLAGGLVLLMRELGGVTRFAVRERLARFKDWQPSGGWHPQRELQWAWRGVRARGRRAALETGLLAVALAACTIVFSAADALLVRRVPFPDADRLVNLGSISPAALREWRRHPDLFTAVHGHVTRPAFLVGENQPAVVDVADVTPGLIEMLGVAPRWGRLPSVPDVEDTSGETVVIGEALARERFGDPTRAVGQRLITTGAPMLVVGVMPPDFRFPAGSYQIWRALDVRSRVRFVRGIARLAPGQSLASTTSALATRAAEVAAASGDRPGARPPGVGGFGAATMDARSRRLLLIVVAATLCLLLTACANVASLELAGAISRTRSFGIHTALGASRSTLVRGSLLEGLLILVPATAIAGAIAASGTGALSTLLPERMFDSVNVIDLDARAFGFMAAAAAVTWALVSVPVAFLASRPNLVAVLQAESRSSAASAGGARVRRALTVVEVAVAVLLLATGTLYARTYRSLAALDKGFDSANLAVLSLTLPMQSYPTARAQMLLEEAVKRRLAARAEVMAVSGGPGSLPPHRGEAYQASGLEIDGRAAGHESLGIRVARVDETFFSTLQVPLRGRLFERSAATEAVIDELMARAFWPDGDAIGQQFRVMGGWPAFTVVGIAGHIRSDADEAGAPSETEFQIYVPRQPPLDEPARTSAAINDLPLYGLLEFAVRLDSRARIEDVLADIRAIDSRFRLRMRSMDDIYASRFQDTWLATSLVTGFAGLAFVLAITGIYGVMAHLVAGRRREIGIRLALGADRRDVSRMVLGASARLVAAGAALGVVAAVAAARWMASQFFGVAPTDPWTYVLVGAVVVATALLASWTPARRAAAIDPAHTLRAE